MKRAKPKTYEAEFQGRKVRVTVPDDYDAYEERQKLAQDLADWLMAGFWPSPKAQRWWRRVRRLARATGQTQTGAYADLRADAEAILAGE